MKIAEFVTGMVERMTDSEVEGYSPGRWSRKELAAAMVAAGIPADKFDAVEALVIEEVEHHQEMLDDQRAEDARVARRQELAELRPALERLRWLASQDDDDETEGLALRALEGDEGAVQECRRLIESAGWEVV